MQTPTEQSLEPNELYVWVTYDNPNECNFYQEIRNEFRTAFWVEYGFSAAIMFVSIPEGVLLPGQTKRIVAYTLDESFSKQLIASGKTYWGPAECAFGTLAL